MDINRLFKAGMNACGRVLEILPEKDIGYPKQFMMEVLQDETLPSINDLHPDILRKNFNVSELISLGVDKTTGYAGYRIPMELVGNRRIRGIKSFHTGISGYGTCQPGQYSNNGYMGSTAMVSHYPNKYGRFSSANLYETAVSSLLSYADLQLLGQYQEAPIPRFQAPNIFWINGAYANANSYFITLLLDNDPHLITVDDEAYEGVKRLFILDLKKVIYNRFGIFSQVDNAVGGIDLKIDDWSSAAQERDELYNEYDSLSHLRKSAIISG